MSIFDEKIFGVNILLSPKWVSLSSYGSDGSSAWALIYTWRQNVYTGNIFLVNSANNQASNWKMARIFLMVYKLGGNLNIENSPWKQR
jgi:hypothetical protein